MGLFRVILTFFVLVEAIVGNNIDGKGWVNKRRPKSAFLFHFQCGKLSQLDCYLAQ